MNRREQTLRNLRGYALDGDNLACIRNFFELIVGLPVDKQLELARREMLLRFDLFAKECDECCKIKELLDDPEKYFQLHGRGNPCALAEVSMDCQVYFNSIDGILLAYKARDHPLILSAACTYTIFTVIGSIQDNELKYKNPVLFVNIQNNNYLSNKESFFLKKIYKEVSQREWTRIVNSLDEFGVSNYTDTVDVTEMRLFYNKWENEDELVLPA